MPLIDYAVQYISQGLPCFPCCWPDKDLNCGCGRGHQGRDIGKVPLTPNGLKDATTNEKQIKDWWTKTPRANIAIAIPPSYFVLDCDVEHNGFESLGLLQEYIGELPKTLQITTGTGGAHFWYKTNKEIRNTTRLGGYEGLDIRGLGGYVVVPPSMHRCGLTYETSPVWGGEITLAPPKLIALCLKSSSPVSATPTNGSTIYIEGQRNDRLSRDAGAMRRRGLSEMAIYAALTITNNEKCSPPLPDSEVRLITKSISRYTPQPSTKRMGVDL